MKIAVVIPCRNEKRYIERCVFSVLNSDYPKENIEILVCDGMSDDGTRDIMWKLISEHPSVRLIDNEKRTTPFALNLGIKTTNKPDVVIILGAHSEIAPDYIRLCVENLQKDTSAGCVGGLLENVNEDATSAIIGIAMSSPFGVGNAHFRTGTKAGYVDTVAFGAYRKEVFEKVGLFDEELVRNQDDEFNFRVTKTGFKIVLDPEIRSKYYVRAEFSKLFRQYYQYGLWKVYVNRKHKAVTSMRQLAPPVFVLFLFSLVLVPVSFCFTSFGIIVAATWILFFALYIFGGVLACMKQKAKPAQFPGIIYSFFLLHSGYGTGYLHGILKFIILRRQPGTKEGRLSR
ncbi:MAG TPA: glycosyltransferase family 2 protein [Bacteroidia bacterium]|nr:glycosyltransferase family 2 protein [Bacteroidia bacterium]